MTDPLYSIFVAGEHLVSPNFELVCNQRDRPEWEAARRTGVGASESAAVLGVSPWGSALSVYAEKLGLAPDFVDNEAMRWGRILEPIVVDEAALEIGGSSATYVMSGDMLRSKHHPFMLATLDAWIVRGAETLPLEVKVSSRAGDWDNGAPPHYRAQVQHQLAVTGAPRGYIAGLLGGTRLVWEEVERDPDFIDNHLIPALADFWGRVTDQIPPAADGSKASAAALKALYPKDTGEEIALPGHLIDLDIERQVIKEASKRNADRLAEIDNEIKQALGSASVGRLASGVSYTYRFSERREYVVAASSGRTLRRSGAKGEK